jgi:hypothetical protein
LGGSGGCGRCGSRAVVVRAGPGGKGDVVAEGIDFGEVVPDLAPGLGAFLVVVGAEVVVARAGAGQERVTDPQLGGADSDLGFVIADRRASRR